MNNFIQLENNSYTVKIGLKNLDYSQLPDLLEMLRENAYNWNNFSVNSDLWFEDGYQKLSCIDFSVDNKTIVFE